MTATGSINIAGEIRTANTRSVGNFPLTQVLADIEVKANEITLLPSASGVSLPFPLSDGVDEALFVAVYAPSPVKLYLSTTGMGEANPFPIGLKGVHIYTCYPGQGITGIEVDNPDAVESVKVEWLIGATDDPQVIPPWWV